MAALASQPTPRPPPLSWRDVVLDADEAPAGGWDADQLEALPRQDRWRDLLIFRWAVVTALAFLCLLLARSPGLARPAGSERPAAAALVEREPAPR